jgi:hypothetical protein
MAEVFVSTSDGKHAGLVHNGTFYAGRSPDELARELGIADYAVQLDPLQGDRDRAATKKAALRARNSQLGRPWGF